MNYRYLGKSGLMVSEISLGGWLTLGGAVNDSLSVELIQHAFYNGVNFFDVADVYSGGHAEEILGIALKSLPRDQIVVATKMCGRMHAGPFGAGLSKKHILQACDASLSRLGTDYIDLYQFHRSDPSVPIEESLEAMDILVRHGKALYIGCSNFSASQIEEAVKVSQEKRYTRFISSQPCFNLLERDAEKKIFPTCENLGIGNIIYSPLAHGVLTGKYKFGEQHPLGSRSYKPGSQFMSRYLTEENLKKVGKLTLIANEAGLAPSVLAIRWILKFSAVSSTIVGATSIKQLDENLQASKVIIDPTVLAKVDSVFS